MPALPNSRQAAPLNDWLADPTGRRLLLSAQAAWPEASSEAAGGLAWLRLLPELDWAMPDPAGRYAGIWTVAPDERGWQGAWRSAGGDIPFASSSISRIDLRFVLEAAPRPEAVLSECARVLCDEGRLLVFGLNPFGAARLRWSKHGLRALRRGAVVARLQADGLEILEQRAIGPRWRGGAVDVAYAGSPRAGFGRVAWAILATRRSSTLTPVRRGKPSWQTTPGVPAA